MAQRAKTYNEQVAEAAQNQTPYDQRGISAIRNLHGYRMMNNNTIPGARFAQFLVKNRSANGVVGGGGGLASSYQSAYDEARAANKSLEAELAQGFKDRYSRGVELAQKFGGGMAEEINRIFNERAAGLRRRFGGGLSGNASTVLERVLSQNEGERALQLAKLGDQTAQRQIAVDSQLSGDMLAQRERVTNAYPDLQLAASLAEKAGAASVPAMQPRQQGQVSMPQYPVPPGRGGRSFSEMQANRAKSYQATRDAAGVARSQAVGFGPNPAASKPLVKNEQGGYGAPYPLQDPNTLPVNRSQELVAAPPGAMVGGRTWRELGGTEDGRISPAGLQEYQRRMAARKAGQPGGYSSLTAR